jgi:hypothetical protein
MHDETKASFLTTEFYAMVGVIVALLVAAWVSDSLEDVRAWTLVSAVAIGYMLSRGLAKSGSTHTSRGPLAPWRGATSTPNYGNGVVLTPQIQGDEHG